MNLRTFIIGVLCIVLIKLNAQNVCLTEDENDIYWQPNTQINYSDYQAPDNEVCLKYNKKYGLTMSSSIGFRGVVDVPKKKGKYDKFYLAPVFCKNCSCILSKDSVNLEVDRLLFDFAELTVRSARRELLGLQKETNADNTYSMFFTSVKNKWEEKMLSFYGTVIREVLIEKKDSAYINWRSLVDELLEETESYRTKPEDCYRFVAKEPIEKGYKMAKTLMSDMRSKAEED